MQQVSLILNVSDDICYSHIMWYNQLHWLLENAKEAVGSLANKVQEKSQEIIK